MSNVISEKPTELVIHLNEHQQELSRHNYEYINCGHKHIKKLVLLTQWGHGLYWVYHGVYICEQYYIDGSVKLIMQNEEIKQREPIRTLKHARYKYNNVVSFSDLDDRIKAWGVGNPRI